MSSQATNSKPAYQVTEAGAADCEDRAVAAWETCRVDLPDSGPEFRARFRWMYLENPAAQAKVYLLDHGADRRCVGFVTVAGREWRKDGEKFVTGLLIDFVVDPAHRTAFPALLLQRHAHQAGMLGKDFIFGIPDVKALPIFKRLNCSLNLPIPRFVRIVRFGKYVARKLPSWLAAPAGAVLGLADRVLVALGAGGCRGEWLTSFDDRFDRIWASAAKPGYVVGRRDAAFLRWRFGAARDAMKIFAVNSGESSKPHTYFVGRVEEDAFVVKDVFTSASGKTLVGALNTFVSAARPLGVNSISMSVLPDEELKNALAATRFVERDHRVCFWTFAEGRAETLKAAKWYLTPADEDM